MLSNAFKRILRKTGEEIIKSFGFTVDKKETVENPVPKKLLKKGIQFGKLPGLQTRKIYFPADELRHKIIIGATQFGKTELAKNIAVNHKGSFCFISNDDGESIDHILRGLPNLEKTVLLDHSNRIWPIGIGNFSQTDNIFINDDIINQWVRYFIANFNIDEQYMTIQILTNTLKVIFKFDNLSLYEIKTFLENERFRSYLIQKINDKELKYFWNNFEDKSDKKKDFLTSSILRRIGVLFQHRFIKYSLGQSNSKLNYRKWIDEGYKVLIKCPKMERIIIPLHILGFWKAAVSRYNVKKYKRNNFMIFCDEPQSWLSKNSDTIDDLFSKSLKYGLALTCIFQSEKQIKKRKSKLMGIILDNRPDIIIFNNEKPPISTKPFTASELKKYEFLCKIQNHDIFKAQSPGKLKFVRDNIDKFKKSQRDKYNVHYNNVEKEIKRRVQLWRKDQNIKERRKQSQKDMSQDLEKGSQKETNKSSNSFLIGD